MSNDLRCCMDIIESILVEIEHLENVIEIFSLGFENNTTDGNDYEISSMYILEKLISQIKEEQILKLSDILESISKNSVQESSI